MIAIWILKLLLIALQHQTAVESQNSPISSSAGVYFDEIGTLLLSPTQWKFVNYIDLNPIKELWKQTKSHQAQVLTVCQKHSNESWYHLTDCTAFATYSRSKIRYVDSLKDIIAGYLNENTYGRQKRGVLNFIGEVSKILFGTATESEIKSYQKHIDTIQKEQREFLKISGEQMTVIKSAILTFNSTMYKIDKNEKMLADKFKNFAEKASMAINKLEESTTVISMMNEQLKQVERGIEESRYTFDILVDAFVHAQDGVLQPQLVTPNKIKSYMDQGKPKEDLDYPPFPISELSKLIIPIIYSFQNYFVYVIQIPLISNTQYQLYKVLPFPARVKDDTFMYLNFNREYIFKDTMHNKYGKMSSNELSNCFNPNEINFVCKEKVPVYTYVPDVDCEATLLHVSNNRVPDVCDKRIVKLTRTHWISLYLSNEWLYVAPSPERFAILCPLQGTRNIVLENQGKLHLPKGCKGYSASATLYASSQIEVNRTELDVLPVMSPNFDCCFDEETKEKLTNLDLDTPLQNILTSADDLKIASYKVSEIEGLIKDQEESILPSVWYQGATWLGSLIVFVLFIIITCCSCCCCKCCRECGFWLWDKWSPRDCWAQARERCLVINTYQPVVSYQRDLDKVSPVLSTRSLPITREPTFADVEATADGQHTPSSIYPDPTPKRLRRSTRYVR